MSSSQGLRNTGKPYEEAAEAFFREKYGATFKVTADVKLPNNLGGREQIDLLLEATPHPDFKPMLIGIEDKDYGRKLTKKDYRDIEGKFRDAGISEGIIVCPHGLQVGAERLRKASKNPPIQLYVKSREELIEGAWSVDFLDALPKLKQAKVDPSPTADIIKKVVLAIESIPYYARYFFHELTNPAWIPILTHEGVFRRALAGQNQVNPNAASDFISRFAKECPNEVLDFAAHFVGPNGWIAEDLLQAGAVLPVDHREKLVQHAANWDYSGFIWTDAAAELILLEAQDGRIATGLELLSKITEVTATPLGQGEWQTYRLGSAVGEHWFEELTMVLLPRLAAVDPAATLEYARARLCSADLAEHPWNEGAFPTYVCNHVGHEEQFRVRDVLQALLFGYRDALLAATESNTEAVILEIRSVLKEACEAAVRCCLYCIAKRPEVIASLIDEVIRDRRLWHRSSFAPELESLIESAWANLTEAQREALTERVLGLGHFDYARDIAPEKLDERRDVAIVQWLAVIEPLGFPERTAERAISTFERLKESTGVSMRAHRGGPILFCVNPVPAEAEEFSKMSAQEVLSLCERFEEHDVQLHTKTPYGVAGKLKEEIRRRPAEFMTLMSEILKLPYPCYHAAAIDGFVEAAQSGELDLAGLCQMASAIVGLEYVRLGETNRSRDVGEPRWTRAEILRAIRDLADGAPAGFDVLVLGCLVDLWEKVRSAEDAAPQGQVGSGFRRVYEESLNSSDGQLAISICALMIRARRMELDEAITDDERAKAGEVYVRIRALVEEFVLGSTTPLVRGPIGMRFTELFFLDRDWAQAEVDRIFDSGDRALWTAAWSTHFMFTQRFREVFRFLRPQYEESVRLMSGATESEPWWDGVGVDIAIAWMQGEFEDADPLFMSFLQQAPGESISSGAIWIQHSLKRGSDEQKWRQAIRFWGLVMEARPEISGDALARMLFWLREAPPFVTVGELEPMLIASLKSEQQFVPPDAFDFLEVRASQEPQSVARVLRAAADLEGAHVATAAAEDMKSALQACYLSGDPLAMDLALDTERRMLIRGMVTFEGVVSALRSASS